MYIWIVRRELYARVILRISKIQTWKHEQKTHIKSKFQPPHRIPSLLLFTETPQSFPKRPYKGNTQIWAKSRVTKEEHFALRRRKQNFLWIVTLTFNYVGFSIHVVIILIKIVSTYVHAYILHIHIYIIKYI